MEKETIKNIMRDVEPDFTEEQLEQHASAIEKRSKLIERVEQAFRDANLFNVGIYSRVYKNEFCLYLKYIMGAKHKAKVVAIMDTFGDEVKLLAESSHTMTYSIWRK